MYHKQFLNCEFHDIIKIHQDEDNFRITAAIDFCERHSNVIGSR